MTVKIQAIPVPALKWPTDIGELYLSTDPRSVNEFLQASDFEMENFPNYIPEGKIFSFEGVIKTLFQKLVILYAEDKSITHIILPLSSRFKIGKGNQRIVKKCYDLVSGQFLVKKQFFATERAILLSLKNQEGIPEIYGFYEKLGKDKEIKIWGIEKLYTPLLKEIETNTLGDLPRKIKIMHDLLKALYKVHENHTHYDIKPQNINLSGSGAVLSDFGLADEHTKLYGAIAFQAPEFFEFLRKYPDIKSIPESKIIAFNLTTSKCRDIWAMAHVFGYILKGVLPSNFCIFKFSEAALFKKENVTKDHSEVFFDRNFIKQEYSSLKEKNPNEAPFYSLMEEMHNIDPYERPSAEQSLQKFEKIIQKG